MTVVLVQYSVESLAMKQLKRSAAAVFLAVMLATTMGCAANLPDESAGEYVDDAVITTKVKAAMLDRPTLKSFEIHVETFKGVVQLRGIVASQSIIDEAVKVARSINGVRSVENYMRAM
jgi:hyperosmotically inducible protein